MRTVLVFRSEVLPSSETFILSQVASYTRFSAVLCGLRRRAGELPGGLPMVLLGSGFVDRLLPRLGLGLRVSSEGWSALCEAGPSIVHAHFAIDGVESLPVVERLGVPLVVTLHGYDVMCKDAAHARTVRGRAYLRGRSELWARVSVLVCVSEAVRTRALEVGFPADKLRVLPIGIDVAALVARVVLPAEALVVFVGRLVPKKGCDVLIEAFAQLQRVLPAARLRIVGDGPERVRLEAMAAALTVGTEFAGVQNSRETLQQMSVARCLAVPSVTASDGDAEGLPTVLFEALALGVPVATTRHSGIPELIAHEQTGLLADEGDVAGLARNLQRLCVEDVLARRLAMVGRQVVEDRFSMAKQTRALEDLYEEAIESFVAQYGLERESSEAAGKRQFAGQDGVGGMRKPSAAAEPSSLLRHDAGRVVSITRPSAPVAACRPLGAQVAWKPLREQAAWLLSGNVASVVFQAVCFLLLGRMLGASQYGALVGAVALVNIGSQFSSLGMEMVVLRSVARDKAAYPTAITRGIVVTCCGFFVLMAVAMLGGHLVLPPLLFQLLPYLALSDALFGKVTQLCSRALQGADLAGASANLMTMNSLGRMLTAAALCVGYWHAHARLDLLVWVRAYTGVACVSMVVAVGVMVRRLGWPGRCIVRLADLSEGLSFSLSNSSISVYNDIDKAMLVFYGMFAAAGIYGAAYRVIDVLSTPVVSLFAAASPRLFREGMEQGAVGAAAGASRLLRWTVPFCLGMAVVLALGAPWMPAVFGHSFRGSTQVLQLLCILPLLRGLHYAWGTAVTACSSQWLRTAAQAASAGLNLGLNVLLIPRWGWRGAAVTSIVTDGCLAGLTYCVLRGLVRRQSGEAGSVATVASPVLSSVDN